MPARKRTPKPAVPMNFKTKDGFDLMSGPGIKPDIIGKSSTNNKVPPLVPGTGMGMGMS